MKQYHHAILASKGSSKQYFKSCQTRFTAASTKHHHLLHTDSSMKGLRAHADNLKVSVLWTPSQAQNHSKPTTASDSPSSGPLEFGSNGSEIVSFQLNQTTPQQWLTNIIVQQTGTPKKMVPQPAVPHFLTYIKLISGVCSFQNWKLEVSIPMAS